MEGFELGRVHPTAFVSKSSRVGSNVTIGPHAIVYDNVEIRNDAIIGPRVTLGEPTAGYYKTATYENPPLLVGARSLIRSNTIIYAGSVLGDGFETGHRVTVREKSKIGRNCRVGTLCDIQGDCVIGEYTRLHSNVHVAPKSTIGSFVWMFPYVVLTSDPYPPSESLIGVVIEDYVVVAAGALLLPGVRVGEGALVGAHSLVRNDVPANGVVSGKPARNLGDVRLMRSRDSEEPLYPWRLRFDRGMPWQEIGFDAWIRGTAEARRRKDEDSA